MIQIEGHRRAPASLATRRVLIGRDGRPMSATILNITDPLISDDTVLGVNELVNPAEWPDLHDRWSAMDPADGLGPWAPEGSGPYRRRYVEVVELRSDFALTTVLEFAWQRLTPGDTDDAADDGPAGAIEHPETLEYWLSRESGHGDGLVTVDEGSIVVSPVAGGVSIRATKRVRFVPPFDGAGLALVANALGYLGAFEQMVDNARRQPPDRHGRARP